MSRTSVWVVGLLGCVMLIGLAVRTRPSNVRRHAQTQGTRSVSASAVAQISQLATPMQAIPPRAPQAGRSLHPSDRVTPTGSSSPSDLRLPAPVSERVRTRQTRDWDDPSLDPSSTREPPRPLLPPSARPHTPAIEPSQAEWRRLRHEEDAVAY